MSNLEDKKKDASEFAELISQLNDMEKEQVRGILIGMKLARKMKQAS